MTDLERAVMCAFDQTADAQLKTSAAQYCENFLRNTPSYWVVCLELLVQSKHQEVKFWCLQALTNYAATGFPTAPEPEKMQFKQGLMTWIREICSKEDVPVFIKNKFAQVLIIVFKQEFPDKWPTFFTELLSMLNLGVNVIDMFLRILKTIDELVVSRSVEVSKEEHIRNTLIKDAMRVNGIPEIFNTCYQILGAYHQSNPAIVSLCLSTIKNYIDWIDIGIVTTENYIKSFFYFITLPDLREQACECLTSIVSKGMEPTLKLELLVRLQIINLLSTLPLNLEEEGDPTLVAVAKLASTVGLQLVECWDKFQTQQAKDKVQSTLTYLDQNIPFLFKLFESANDDVSGHALNFVNAYIHRVKSQPSLTQSQTEHLAQLLQIIYNRIKFTSDFNFNAQDEYETEFLAYRKSLLSNFKTIARAVPQLCQEFIKALVSKTLSSLNALPFQDVEACLTLFYEIGEPIAMETKNEEGMFFQTMGLLLSSNISSYPHHAVSLVYFEIIDRYINFFVSQPSYIPQVMASFMDQRGIRHPNPSVRSRACYLLGRIVKKLKVQLVPFVDDIFKALKDFLVVSLPGQDNSRLQVSFNDKLFIYEALGILLGSDKIPQTKRIELIETTLSPLITQMGQIIMGEYYKKDTPENPTFATLLGEQISAIGYLSKGFTGNIENSKVIFKRILDSILQVFNTLPKNTIVREKTIFFLHRMIEVLDESIVDLMPSTFANLINVCDENDFTEVIMLINQLVMKLKSKAFSVANDLFMPVATKVFTFAANLSLAQNPSQTLSEEARQLAAMQKSYFSMIHAFISNDCIGVLTSPTNAPHLDKVLATVLQGATTSQDFATIKLCFIIYHKLIDKWAGSGEGSLPGFNQYVYEHITKACFVAPMQPYFDLRDASANNVLNEIVNVQRTILAKCGVEFLTYLNEKLFPALQLPQQEAALYIQAIQSQNQNDFKKYFKQLIESKKQATR